MARSVSISLPIESSMSLMNWFQEKRLADQPAQGRCFRLAQLTDCHLFADGALWHGIDSSAYLTRVLAHLSRQHWDCVVVTGDISQDHSAASYRKLQTLCQHYLSTTPVAWLPGNHDELAQLQAYCQQPPFITQKQLHLGNWQLLLLNSKGPTPAGLMTASDLAQLRHILQQLPPQHNVAVFCHHHVLPVGGYIDKHIMHNGEALLALLAEFGQVKCISHGHVHQQKETLIPRPQDEALRLWATPSTSIGFTADNEKCGVDDCGPGFRCFELWPDGRVHSEVVWL